MIRMAAGVLASLGACLGAGLALPAAAAPPGTTVIGGGLSLACSDAAKTGLAGAQYEALCSSALNTEPMLPLDRAGTLVNRGIIKLRAGRFSEAITDFDAALEYKADFAEAYVNRGAADIGSRRFAEGVADLNKAIALGVKEPEKAYYNRALAYEWLDNPKAAWLDYQKALELAPDWALVQQQLWRFKISHADAAAPAAPGKP